MRSGPPEDKARRVPDLSTKAMGELRRQAHHLNIPGWAGMTRDELINALEESENLTEEYA